MQEIIDAISGKISYFLIFPLIGTGIYLTARLKIVQLLHFGHAWKVIAGIYDDPEHEGDINHLQALSAALSATIGIGNIAGVATAIHFGGPGALFWMWVTAFVGMATKFSEATLAMKYRKIHSDGSASGGPMYYIEMGLGKPWKLLAVTFAFCTIISSFGSGNTIQAFSVADSFRAEFGVPPYITGLITATLVGIVILGGIKRVGVVASRLVPFMAFIYIVSALVVIVVNIQAVPAAFALIFKSAFTPTGAVGGFFGSTFSMALLWGVKRGLFSNESGQGSAPIAHAAAKTDEPVREGTVAMVGPFIDTLVICTLTGLTIITSGAWHKKYELELGMDAFRVVALDAQFNVGAVLRDDSEYVTGNFQVIDGFVYSLNREIEDTSSSEPAAYVEAHIQFFASESIIENARFVSTSGLTREEKTISEGILSVKKGVAIITDIDGNELENVILVGEGLLNGSPLTARAFSSGLGGRWGSMMVTLGVFLFAVSTAISWSYYGDRATVYLFGRKYVKIYRSIYVLAHFGGSMLALKTVWGLGDIALSLMAFPNLIGLLFLAKKVQYWKEEYFKIDHKPISKVHF